MSPCRVPQLSMAIGLASITLLSACRGEPSVTGPASQPSAAFDLRARYVDGSANMLLRASVTRATRRWQDIITRDVGTARLEVPAGECQPWLPAINEPVNDLLVFVREAEIDGPDQVIARSSPCYVSADTKLPVLGFLEIDRDDLPRLIERGVLDDVILHELGHVLGIGTMWNYRRALLVGAGTPDPYFAGTAARAGFLAIGGGIYGGAAVPVDNSEFMGTRDAHWRGSVFAGELMRGVVVAGGMALSRVTVGSLADLGYAVSYARADQYTLANAIRIDDLRRSALVAPPVSLHHDVHDGPVFEVDAAGRRTIMPSYRVRDRSP